MNQEKNVIIYPNDMTGSGCYRLHWPGAAVKAQGKQVIVLPRAPQIVVDKNGQVHGVNVGTYNVVVFQRPGSYQFIQAIPILQDKGIKVVIDLDDSLSTIHPRNVAFKSYDPRVSHERNWMHAARACELADLVTVTTDALAEEYGSHGRVAVIPNHIPESYLKIPRPQNEIPTIIWAGWIATHPDDLIVTRGIINQVLIDTGAKFAAFGDDRIFQDLQIRNRPPNEHWSFTNITEYPNRLAKADIGLVPLRKSKFNDCKSWLKGLEYASVGVVPVMSPTPDNLKLNELGIGLMAEKPKDWYDQVKLLVLDNEMRQEMSDNGRKICESLTIEGNWEKWWNVWSA